MNQDNKFNNASILIVDDNVRNLQVLGGFLKNEGLIAEFAIDGNSALSWLGKKKFDLILLDIMMPGMDGFELSARIKENPTNCDTPFIFITAKTDTDSIIKGFGLGSVDYITKPFIQNELLARVKTQIKIKRDNEQLTDYLRQIEERNRNISDSIDYAKYIQNAASYTSERNLKFLPEHFILDLPKDILSGDFYWCHETERELIIAVMDCTGHGVPGALMSIMGITLLNETVLNDHITQPDKILESLRLKIITTLGQKKGNDNVKVAIEGAIICFYLESNILLYSGSFNPMILIHNDKIFDIKADRIPIGYYELKGNFTLHEINIEKNDAIYLFSDGITDQFGGPEDRRFMFKNLKEILQDNHNKPMMVQKQMLTERLNRWKGDLIQTDDILVLGIRF
jgi:phosphoserine phosphatase RsbU/P